MAAPWIKRPAHIEPRATLLCLVDLLHKDLAVNHKSLRISCVCLGTTYMLRVYVYMNVYIWICNVSISVSISISICVYVHI